MAEDLLFNFKGSKRLYLRIWKIPKNCHIKGGIIHNAFGMIGCFV
jgi:hypothetical protein